jgi:hypothetical protein
VDLLKSTYIWLASVMVFWVVSARQLAMSIEGQVLTGRLHLQGSGLCSALLTCDLQDMLSDSGFGPVVSQMLC